VWIENVWVDSNNHLWCRINGVQNYYKLHVRRVRQGWEYQIYNIPMPKTLWILSNVLANTVYCVEIRTNDNGARHDITSYRMGGSGPPYYGEIYLDEFCPVDHTYNVRLTRNLVIDPSTPVQGQNTRATFGTVCNDGANMVQLNDVHVGVNTGERWPTGGNLRALACGECRATNYNQQGFQKQFRLGARLPRGKSVAGRPRYV
jgi:hypothetical protein